jgi:hypothetical protein
LAFTDAEQAWARMADFGPEQAVPGALVLLNLMPELPERPGGFFDLGVGSVVGRVVYRLVRSLKDPQAIESAVKDILPQVTTLSSKIALIDMVGHREGVGHRLVSEESARTFQRDWRLQVGAASGDLLAGEMKENSFGFLLSQRKRPSLASHPSKLPTRRA